MSDFDPTWPDGQLVRAMEILGINQIESHLLDALAAERMESATLRAQVAQLREALLTLYSFPEARELLAPKESMGSIAFLVEGALEATKP